ncbi:hypothetical protein [Novosphingobium sp.]|uniref:hypothetical protein n=1 Tax=Novosphingobium sp. TaxID=1874826 RepID=UPI0038BD5C6F
MRRAEALLPLLALAACGQGGEVGPPLRHIDCALAGATAFKPDCTVEPAVQNGRTVLVVAAPDGMFRRFEKVGDGRGVIVADGVEQSTAHWVADGVLEVSVGQDRYRFPASLKPDTSPSDAPTP